MSSSSLAPANINQNGSSSSAGPASYGSSSSFIGATPVIPVGSSSMRVDSAPPSGSEFASVNTGMGNPINLNIQALQTQASGFSTFASTEMGTLLSGASAKDQSNLTVLNQKLAEFRTFNNNLRATISSLTKDIDISRRTQQLGSLRERIKKLENLEATAREEADTAESRLQYVEKREQDVSYKQLFFLERSVRQFSVPTFVTLSVLFALLAIRMIYLLYSGVQVGAVDTAYLTGFGAPTAGLFGLGAPTGLFGVGQPAPLAGLFSSTGITGQLR